MGSTDPGRDPSGGRAALRSDHPRPRHALLTAYADSSALVALFSREPAHGTVRVALEALGPIASARLTFVEVRSALGVAHRGRRLSNSAFSRARSEFADFWDGVDVIELGVAVADAAVRVSDAFGLRSHDSIQLASALQEADVTMVALDNRLRRAAIEAGLAVAP